MDEHRETPPRESDAPAPPALAFDQPLPFDDEADRPVPYELTARARRTVAPEALPDLEVVGRPTPGAGAGPADGARPRPTPDADGALEQPGDTRPSRARALRRAGLSVVAIARQLAADELAVRAWLGDLATGPGGARPVALVPDPRSSAARGDDAHAGARQRARAEAAERLRADPSFAAGLGLVAGVADVDEHGIGVTTTDPRIARTVVSWLLGAAGVPVERVRVVLRLGSRLAADLARHRWSDALGLPLEQVIHTRARGLAEGAEEVLLRISDPVLAATVAGWADALLDPAPPEPLDAAF